MEHRHTRRPRRNTAASTAEDRYYGEWEFSPYNGEYPERVKAVVDVRQAAADAVLLGA